MYFKLDIFCFLECKFFIFCIGKMLLKKKVQEWRSCILTDSMGKDINLKVKSVQVLMAFF